MNVHILKWTVFEYNFYSLINHSKRFTVQVPFTHSHTHSYSACKTSAVSLNGNLGLNILPRGTLEGRLVEPGIELPTFSSFPP